MSVTAAASSDGAGAEPLELLVERERQLHLLEHLVLDVGLVALQRALVVLEGLQLRGT